MGKGPGGRIGLGVVGLNSGVCRGSLDRVRGVRMRTRVWSRVGKVRVDVGDGWITGRLAQDIFWVSRPKLSQSGVA